MPLDPSIALQTQAPNPTNLISSFIDLGQKKLNLDKSRQTFDADVAQAKAQSSSAQSAATVNAANVQPLIAQQAAQTGFEQFKLSGAQAQQGMQLASGLISDPDFIKGNSAGMMEKLNDAKQTMTDQFGIDPTRADAIVTTLKYQALHNPQQVRQSLINMTQQQQGGAGQQAAAFPAPAMVTTGPTVQPTAAGNPALTGVQPGTPLGQGIKLGLPPTTPVMRNGVPGYSGAPSDVQAAPAIGQAEATTGPIATNNQHYAKVQSDAETAPTRIAALQTIKQEAPTAATGGGDYRRTFFSQLSGLFGLANDKQTATDVMAKNLAVLAGQAGNTDASRSLGEMATPSFHMTQQAAQKTADQLIGIEAKKQAAQDYFQGTPTNSPLYAQKMAAWNKNADPRAFEYAAKSPEEQAAMKTELIKAGTWNALQQKMRQLHAMGVDPQ